LSAAAEKRLDINKKFGLAMAAFAVLAILVWITMSDEPLRVFDRDINLRYATLCVLGLFAVRTVLHFLRVRLEKGEDKDRALNSPM
jgi:hypothetical protein